MAERYAFMSEGWIAALEQEAQRLLDASQGASMASFTYVERFTGAPEPRQDGLETGYAVIFEASRVAVRSGVRIDEAADCAICMAYQDAEASLALKSGPELGALMGEARARGNFQMTGSVAGMPVPGPALHDAICDRSRLPAGNAKPSLTKEC